MISAENGSLKERKYGGCRNEAEMTERKITGKREVESMERKIT